MRTLENFPPGLDALPLLQGIDMQPFKHFLRFYKLIKLLLLLLLFGVLLF
jgi:hypothetical protein